MARPTNRNVSKITPLGLSVNGIKGAVAVAVLGTLATQFTNNFVSKIQARTDARKTAKASKEATETTPSE